MKILIILWVLSLDTLGSTQKVFDGTLKECRATANQMMLEDELIAAGCYETSKQPPYLPEGEQ